MRNLYNNFIAAFMYIFFGLLDVAILYGILVVAFGGPYLVAKLAGSEWGDNLHILALIAGLLLAGGWYFLMEQWGTKRLERFFRALTHSTIKKFGAGDAISEK